MLGFHDRFADNVWTRSHEHNQKSATEEAHQLKERSAQCVWRMPHFSRKNIARGKQRSHQQARQAISEVLLSQRGPSDVLDEEVDSKVKDRTIVSKRKSFKKWPDAPLADVLYRKKMGEVTEFTGNTVQSKTLAALRKKS